MFHGAGCKCPIYFNATAVKRLMAGMRLSVICLQAQGKADMSERESCCGGGALLLTTSNSHLLDACGVEHGYGWVRKGFLSV